MRNADQHSGISFWLTVFTGGAPPAKVAPTFRNRTVDMNCAFIVHSVTLYNCPFGWTRMVHSGLSAAQASATEAVRTAMSVIRIKDFFI